MKISEIVKLESANEVIILHREGIFWMAYEVSAIRFVNHIKSYNIKSKYYKNIRKGIVYMGFLSSVMGSNLNLFDLKTKMKNMVGNKTMMMPLKNQKFPNNRGRCKNKKC